MALLFERGSGTAVNIDSTVLKRSQTNGTAARKFAAPDLSHEQQTKDVSVKTNDEHMVEKAAALKGVSMLAEAIATDARESLAATRLQVSRVSGESRSDVRPDFVGITESDISAGRDLMARSLSNRFPRSLLDTKGASSDLHKLLPGNVFQARLDRPSPPTFNPRVPDLSSVTVDMDKRKGTVDCFFTRVLIELPRSLIQDGSTKLIRIFRSTVISPVYQRGIPTLSMQGIERISSGRARFRSKNLDSASQLEIRLREDGILNAISILNPIDPTTNLRLSANVRIMNPVLSNPVPSTVTLQSPASVSSLSFVNAPRLDALDPSVATDLKVLKNIRDQDPAVAAVSFSPAMIINMTVARKTGLLNPAQVPNQGAKSKLVVDQNNSQEYREIATLTLDRIKARAIGDEFEYSFLDDQVGFGKAYRYYATTVDKNMIESGRSRIVEVTIEGIRVPEMPRRCSAFNVQNAVVLNSLVEDQLVEKFEVYRKESNPAAIRQIAIAATVLASPRGFNVDLMPSVRLDNNFIKVGECLNGSSGAGGMFYDRNVIPGQKYLYRVFSVDVFGNKSERPFELEIYVPDRSSRPNDLIKPHLTSEVDAETNRVRLTFRCTDPRVRGLFISRRDLTIGQTAFTSPGGVNNIRLGNPKGAEGPTSFECEVLRGENKDLSWTGFFENNLQETVFIDRTAALDHTYQYKIYGMDKYGNKTSDDVTKPLMVTRKPAVDAPVNVTFEVVAGPNSTVGGITIRWQEGNISVPAEDQLGNQSDLRDTGVRVLYQVERRKVGEERWIEFPLISDLQFFDPSPSVLGRDQPAFRPPTVQENQTYVYRVKAVQTGSFTSNYTVSPDVFAALRILPPTEFKLKASDSNVRPAYTVLNWGTPVNSGAVDRWEIQRSVVNNVAAARLNPKNSADFQALKFAAFRTVHRESSRFRAHSTDMIRGAFVSSATPSKAFTGQHQFQDMEVQLGNTYFYRIRSVGLDGIPSSWSYRGMKLTDQSFEKKMNTVIDPELRFVLARNSVPLVLKGLTPETPGLASFSFQPGFTKQKEPQVQVGVDTLTFNPGGGTVAEPTVQPTYQGAFTKKMTGF